MARRRINQRKPQGEFSLHFNYYKTRLRAWYSEKKLLFYSVLKFFAYLAALYFLSLTATYQSFIYGGSLVDARLASGALAMMGEKCHVQGPSLFLGEDCIVTVLPACTAFEFSWFLIAAILSFPAPWSYRILGVGTGVCVLLMLNVIRVMTLYYFGIHYTALLDVLHVEVWGVILNICMATLLVAWIMWAKRNDRSITHGTV
jgi:exosortase/archaeosortase family protein